MNNPLDLTKLQTDGEYLLLTCNDWFMAKDGNTYHYVWGKVRIIPAKVVLGFEAKNHANWIYQVGEGEDAVFLVGCRVMYAQLCPREPKSHLNSILKVS